MLAAYVINGVLRPRETGSSWIVESSMRLECLAKVHFETPQERLTKGRCLGCLEEIREAANDGHQAPEIVDAIYRSYRTGAEGGLLL